MNSLNNLIKSLMLAMVILGGTSFSMADPLPGDDPIIFELGRHDPTIAHGDYPRNPINPPSAYLDDHTLYISCLGKNLVNKKGILARKEKNSYLCEQ